MKQKHKEIISLTILTVIYLVCIVRYFPGRPFDSLTKTMWHLLGVAPYSIGITVIIVSSLQKINGVRPAWNSIARIYLTLGLVIEFFCGLYNYLERAQGSM